MQEKKSHYDLNDQEFIRQFANATLSPTLFTHEAHIRLAWIHIKDFGLSRAEANVSKQLKNYVKSVGAEDKYNETITLASIKAVNHFIAKSKTNNFRSFIQENKRLLTDFKNLLQSHYSNDIFNCEKAKNKFMEPDLVPF